MFKAVTQQVRIVGTEGRRLGVSRKEKGRDTKKRREPVEEAAQKSTIRKLPKHRVKTRGRESTQKVFQEPSTRGLPTTGKECRGEPGFYAAVD